MFKLNRRHYSCQE